MVLSCLIETYYYFFELLFYNPVLTLITWDNTFFLPSPKLGLDLEGVLVCQKGPGKDSDYLVALYSGLNRNSKDEIWVGFDRGGVEDPQVLDPFG